MLAAYSDRSSTVAAGVTNPTIATAQTVFGCSIVLCAFGDWPAEACHVIQAARVYPEALGGLREIVIAPACSQWGEQPSRAMRSGNAARFGGLDNIFPCSAIR